MTGQFDDLLRSLRMKLKRQEESVEKTKKEILAIERLLDGAEKKK